MKEMSFIFLFSLLIGLAIGCTNHITPGKYLSPDGQEYIIAGEESTLEFHLKSNDSSCKFNDVKCKYSINNMGEVCPSCSTQAELFMITEKFSWKWDDQFIRKIRYPVKMLFKKNNDKSEVDINLALEGSQIPEGRYNSEDANEYIIVKDSKIFFHVLLVDEPPKFLEKEYGYTVLERGDLILFPMSSVEYSFTVGRFHWLWDGENIQAIKSHIILFERQKE